MTNPNAVLVAVTCECGEKYQVGIAGIELETMQFTCPECGTSDRFTADQITQIVAGHKSAAEKARDAIRKAVIGGPNEDE